MACNALKRCKNISQGLPPISCFVTTRLLDRLIWLGSALSILFWAFVAYRLMRFAENYIGWNVLDAMIFFGVLSGLAGFKVLASDERWAKALLVYAALSGLGVMLLYHFNILIPYEIWLDCGMHPRPF